VTLLYDASVAAVLQTGNWQCSAASCAWLLDALGIFTTQDDVVAALGPDRIDPSLGLHDASGSGLVAVLADPYHVQASSAHVTFDDALRLAESGPYLLGGVGWDHWTGVRGADGSSLQLANPSPGWRGVGTSLSRDQFAQLGPFYGVWPTDVQPAPASAAFGAPPSSAAPSGSPASAPVPVWAWLAGGLAVAWALDLV
jgi:hypothetical protein